MATRWRCLRTLSITAPGGQRIPLTQLAEIVQKNGFAEVDREANSRRVAIKWSVRDRDMGSLVNEAMAKVTAAVTLPPGYRMVWSGPLRGPAARAGAPLHRRALVIFIIFILLFGAFNSVGTALPSC
jgi:cobalt-zinc-cadmium resistance protein CzcA